MQRKQTKMLIKAKEPDTSDVSHATFKLSTWANDLITKRATSEGYRNVQDPNAPHVFEFIVDHLTGPYQHPFGEVITKLLRFTKSGDPEDLAKAVAWIVLVYRHHINKGEPV